MKAQLLVICLLLSAFACKPKKEATSTIAPAAIADESSSAPPTTGKVSHSFRATGCKVVINVENTEGYSLTLIPKDDLPQEFDIDGLTITFDYLTLRMPQPEGCSEGIPASITNIRKK